MVSASFFIAKDMLAKDDGPIYGHGNMRYRMNNKWSKADPNINPVNDCHEFVQDKKGPHYAADQRDEKQCAHLR